MNDEETRRLWDAAAATFDEAPDHGLRDATVRTVWVRLLEKTLGEKRGTALDLGCGTGSLSVILAEMGYTVTGVDMSPEMIARAREKVDNARQTATFHVMDAASPDFESVRFDVVLCRHVLWALPEPEKVLQRWVNLLKPDGMLVLIEGYWHTDAGLHAVDVVKMMPDNMRDVTVHPLSDQPELWGGAVTDERYVIRATKKD